MVFCMVIGCSNDSYKVKGHYASLPIVRIHEGPFELERSTRRRDLWLKAIARADLTESKMKYERVCFRHFFSGKPAALWDEHSIDWVPGLRLGHYKHQVTSTGMKRLGRKIPLTQIVMSNKKKNTVTEVHQENAREKSDMIGSYSLNHMTLTDAEIKSEAQDGSDKLLNLLLEIKQEDKTCDMNDGSREKSQTSSLTSDVRCKNTRKKTVESCSNSDINRCPVCKKSFVTFDDLKSHIQEHVDERQQHDCTEERMKTDKLSKMRDCFVLLERVDSMCSLVSGSVLLRKIEKKDFEDLTADLKPTEYKISADSKPTEYQISADQNPKPTVYQILLADLNHEPLPADLNLKPTESNKPINPFPSFNPTPCYSPITAYLHKLAADRRKLSADHANIQLTADHANAQKLAAERARLQKLAAERARLQKFAAERARLQKLTADRANLQLAADRANNKPYRCGECEKAFATMAHLNMHMIRMHEEKKYSCDRCDYSCSMKYYLIRHYESFHECNKPHKCLQCNFETYDKSTLTRHVVAKHDKLRPYKCSVCGRKFAQIAQRNNHYSAVHRLEKPYSCELCGIKFSQMDHVRRHKKVVHEGIKEFSCGECGKSYSRKDKLKIHWKAVHYGEKPYECGKCKKTFSKRGNYELHIDTVQKGIKVHDCGECSKSFAQKSQLLYHAKTFHTKEKSYTCYLCDKNFQYLSILKLHMMRHVK